ncbi:hypothetical protein EG68_01231 [Paragonimus skrjabini miyazakii]|uniref:non-specific serine/threonine protein kinase n=1 Tax=Paragonimus skrjabini miyazakii TaxID=59628 RepID=A0A8S9ZBA2_9TREM|nr:hypothetical protein EG68_01231 [Paragonimus skrjabini miyazakii]
MVIFFLWYLGEPTYIMIESKIRTVQYIRDFPELSQSLTILDKKGQGTFASVFAVKAKDDEESRTVYALKMLIPTVDVRRIENEIRILRRLGGNCNVIKMLTAWRIRDHVFIMMPFINFVPFGEYYLTADEIEIRRYMHSLLLALSYIHKYRIIHRDIKPTNFLMDQHSRRLFLVDFGLAHSEQYGDLDEKWEADCESYDITAKRGITVNHASHRRSKRTLSPDLERTKASHPAKTSRVHLSNERSQLDGLIGHQASPGTDKVFPQPDRTSLRGATTKFTPKLSLGLVTSTASSQNLTPGSCVCGFRLAVCRGCRQLPRLTAARRGGTLGFRPPEVMMRHVDQTTAVDVWAAGVIFLSFLSGRYPFIKVDDDLDVLHAFTHLVGFERMQAGAKSLGRRLLVDPKPPPMDASDTPSSLLKTRCIAIRRHEKKLIGLPPLLSKSVDVDSIQPELKKKGSMIALSALHVFPSSAYDLLARLLEPNPQKRISAHDALRHPFFLQHAKIPNASDVSPKTATTQTSGRTNHLPVSNTISPFRLRAQFC